MKRLQTIDIGLEQGPDFIPDQFLTFLVCVFLVLVMFINLKIVRAI